MAERKFPAPALTAESQSFWDAARGGRFVLPVCAACDKAHWYPRAICPFCDGAEIEWRDASGRGTIYTFSVMRRAKEPYVIAYVTLAEGPTMLTNIVDCAVDGLHIGDQVAVRFAETENGPPVPVFKPV